VLFCTSNTFPEIVYIGSHLCNLLGYERRECIGKSWKFLFPEIALYKSDALWVHMAKEAPILNNIKDFEMQQVFKKRNGECVRVLCHYKVTLNKENIMCSTALFVIGHWNEILNLQQFIDNQPTVPHIICSTLDFLAQAHIPPIDVAFPTLK